MLEPEEHVDPRSPVPWSERAQQRITTQRIDKWREELTAEQVSQIEWVVGTHMETFGYQRSMDPPSSLTIARGLGFAGFDFVRMRLPQIPGIWYHLTRPTKLAREEFWMHRRWPRGRAPHGRPLGSRPARYTAASIVNMYQRAGPFEQHCH